MNWRVEVMIEGVTDAEVSFKVRYSNMEPGTRVIPCSRCIAGVKQLNYCSEFNKWGRAQLEWRREHGLSILQRDNKPRVRCGLAEAIESLPKKNILRRKLGEES